MVRDSRGADESAAGSADARGVRGPAGPPVPGAATWRATASLDSPGIALGVGPRDLISILQSIKAAGALQAEIVVQ